MADLQVLKALLPDNPLCGISTYKDTLNLATGACTRQVKKVVLTGQENYGVSGNNTWLIIGNDTLDFRGAANGVYCSHVPTVLRTDLTTNTCCWGGGQIGDLIININNYSGESLKTYITAQYSAGTPVTVWYVLATPTTETITIPTGLSGTVEGYLNQDGIPTPTNPIYPTANNVEIWLHSLRKLTTATEAVENPLYSDGTAITSYTIKGNAVSTPETAAVNEPLMKIGDYADTVSNAASIPTTEGANSITVGTTVQPSEFTATWTGWHNANVKEWDGSQWNE